MLTELCQLNFENLTIALAMVREGSLRAPGRDQRVRSPLAPELPAWLI